MSNIQPIDPVDAILQEVKDKYPYLESPKFITFFKNYLDESNKETFGNATRSVIDAYGLDPDRQYAYARKLGSELVTKGNLIIREYMERKGVNPFKLADIALSKTLKTNNPAWFDRLREMMGYEVKPTEQVTTVQNNQFNILVQDPQKVKEFNEKYEKFLEGIS